MKKDVLSLIIFLLGLLIRPGPTVGNQTDNLYTRRFAFLVGANPSSTLKNILIVF